MTKIYCLGDVHGNTIWTQKQIRLAADAGCEKLFQVGDWGLGFAKYDRFNKAVNKAAKEAGIDVYFIRGNHDSTETVDRYIKKKGNDLFYKVYPHLYYVPDGSFWEWDGIKFGAYGGAVSIDKKLRTLGVSWWPGETTNPAAVNSASAKGIVDVLFSHDGPTQIRQVLGIKPLRDMHLELESYNNGMVMNDLIKELKPKVHIFGHWHSHARWDCYGVDTILLNNEFQYGSSLIIDTEKLTEQWKDAKVW